MATVGTGNHASSNSSSFLGLTTPVHLPILTTNDGTASTLLPIPQVTRAAEVTGFTDVPPSLAGLNFGNTDYFQFNNNDSETLTGVTLCARLDGLVAGAGGANPSYPDDVLCQAVETVTFQYGKDLQVLTGDRIHYELVQETEEHELARRAELQGLGWSHARRVANATVARWYYLEIPFWWANRDSDAWHQYAMQKLTRIIIKWRPASEILQQEVANTQPTALAGGSYILDHFVRFNVTALTEATKQEFLTRVKGQGAAGWLYLLPDNERLQQSLQAGQTTHVIQLNTFTKYGYNLRFVIRTVASLTPNYLHNRRFENLDLVTMTLDISGKRYLFPTDNTWAKYEINDRLFKGNPELAIYNIPFNDHPDMHTSAMGGFDFSNASNPQLTLTTAALPAACFIDFWLYCHNYVRETIVGNESGAELVQPL